MAFTQNLGNKFISGSLHYSSIETDMSNGSSQAFYPETTTFTFSPKVGFFVKPQWALGVGVSYGYKNEFSNQLYYYNSNSPTTTEKITHSFSLAPFTRYYLPMGTKVAFFGQATASYTTGSIKYRTTDASPAETDLNGLHVYVTPGLVFFPSSKVGIECTFGEIGYQNTKSESVHAPKSTYTTKGFTSKLGLEGLSLGVSLYIGRASTEE
ncbi:hypothetical protein TH61_06920 [Rufibacter sp. DG15C]|nr:hypothetical protein TH61_06920 [Rufibacter sp. DG15C]